MKIEKNVIPNGWKITKLGKYVRSQKGKKPKNISKEKNEKCYMPYVNIKAFEKNEIDEYTDGEKCVLCDDGDFLMVWDGSRSGYVGKAIRGVVGSTLVKLTFPDVVNEYAYYFLQSKYLEINTRAKGTGTPHVDPNLLWNYDFPIPPTGEQQKIVDKISELLSEIDKGIAILEETKVQLEIYRNAILKSAFSGELSSGWRADNTEVKSSENLVSTIDDIRKIYFEKSNMKYKHIAYMNPEVISKLTNLPKEWVWLKLENLTLNVEYGTSKKSLSTGKVPVLRMGNIQKCKFDWNDLVYSSDQEEINKYRLRKNDVLFNRTNSPELVGKTAIYKENKEAIFAGYLIRINQIEELINADYLNYYLNSYTAKSFGNSVKTDGVNQSNINGTKLKNYPIPYCSLEEQLIIVSEIERRLTVYEKIEEIVESALIQSEALKLSIFKKAFEGRLL